MRISDLSSDVCSSDLLHMNLDPSAADRIRIVLVGTQHPGNIGSAARALKTMGLDRLVLVAPQRFPHADAIAMAAGADDVLRSEERRVGKGGVSTCRSWVSP